MGSSKRPQGYGWTEAGSFGAFTVAKRFPKIADELEGCGLTERRAINTKDLVSG